MSRHQTMPTTTQTRRPRARRTGRVWLALVLALVASSWAAGGLFGCDDETKDDGTKPHVVKDLPKLELSGDTPNLLITWIDDKGETHTEVAFADVPKEARSLVRVVITDKKEGQGSRFYVADLTQQAPEGTYLVRTMTRLEWEDIIEKRRQKYLAKVAPPPPPTTGPSTGPSGKPPPGMTAAGVTAIVYGAAWCKPCHQAKAYLKNRGVQVTYQDIEKDPRARAELQSKLKRAGQGGRAIPVIDVGGQLLFGFNPQALDAAVKRAQRGTAI